MKRLQADAANSAAPGTVSGDVIDGSDSDSIKALFEKLGEIEHLVWTSGPPPRFGEKGLEDGRDELFDKASTHRRDLTLMYSNGRDVRCAILGSGHRSEGGNFS